MMALVAAVGIMLQQSFQWKTVDGTPRVASWSGASVTVFRGLDYFCNDKKGSKNIASGCLRLPWVRIAPVSATSPHDACDGGEPPTKLQGDGDQGSLRDFGKTWG